MKKILLALGLFLLTLPTFALEIDLTKSGKEQKYINEIGFRILNANKIGQRANFYYYDKKNIVNAWSRFSDRQITVTKGLLAYIDDDNEIAGILAHEIAHSVQSYDGILKGFFTPVRYAFLPRKYEMEADKKAVDYMVKAGYNPVGYIAIQSKLFSQTRYDIWQFHPLSSKRMATVYEYIYRKYPAYLADNKYIDNIYYQNFLITSQKNREKLKNSINTSARIKYN